MTSGIEPGPDRSWEEFVKDAQLQDEGMSKLNVDRRRVRVRKWGRVWVAVTWGSLIGGFVGNLLAECTKMVLRHL